MKEYCTYPAYKPSSVSWLGDVPEHWEVRRLKHWVGINEAVLPETTEPDFQFPYLEIGIVGTGQLVNQPTTIRFGSAPSRARRIVRTGDTIVSTVRTYLKATWFAEEMKDDLICSTGFAVLTPRNEACPKFVSFLAQNSSFTDRVTASSVGTAYPAIPESQLGTFHVPLPPLPEQRAIVRYLDYVDRRIRRYVAAKRKLIGLLEEEKQAIVNQAVTRGLDPNVRLKPSGVEWLGDVPEHWQVGSLKRFAARRLGSIKAGPFGSQLTAAEMTGGDFKVYTQRNVIDRDLQKGSNYISSAKFDSLRAFDVVSGDVLVTSRGTIGRTALVSDGCEPGVLHPCLLRIQPDLGCLVPEFLMTLIQDSQLLPQQLTFLSNTTTIDVIYSSTLSNIVIPLPPLPEQAAILDLVDKATADLSAAIIRARRQIQLVQEYRTRLIADVVTGKLDVREAAAQLPEEGGECDEENLQ